MKISGLSPLARGTPCASNHSFGDTRFIPAGAGNTTVTKSVSGRVSVYPRWRGEHESTFINISCTGGLSPLARGTRDYQRGQIIYCRFIPAGAGNTGLSTRSNNLLPVYPRWRGEHQCCKRLNQLIQGLSPLARGTPAIHPARQFNVRFIPAGAGNTHLILFANLDCAVYPRWRGEHLAGGRV